ncbi:MAG: L-threonylcarbamoyladenylate synthase [Promethearchaeota archaeon]
MVRQLHVNPEKPDSKVIGEAAAVIRRGGLIILPTDTAYGLAGNPLDKKVVKRILAAKKRSKKLGIPVLAANIIDVKEICILSNIAKALATSFWPGGLTLILSAQRAFPDGVIGPNNTIAVRIPNHPIALQVIRETGFVVTGTSANRSNEPSPRTAENAIAQVGEKVDLVLDSGPTYHSADSTIINCTIDPPQLIRTGVVDPLRLRPWLDIA